MVRFLIEHRTRRYSHIPTASTVGSTAIHNGKAAPFLHNLVSEIYNLLKGRSLPHNQRGINWCLLFASRHRKHEFVVNLFHLMDHNLLRSVGVTIVGRVSDHIVIKWRKKRKGVWYPEDRLRAAIVPLAVIIPLSLLAFGLVNRFVDGTLGLRLSLVCLFVNGGGVSWTNVELWSTTED